MLEPIEMRRIVKVDVTDSLEVMEKIQKCKIEADQALRQSSEEPVIVHTNVVVPSPLSISTKAGELVTLSIKDAPQDYDQVLTQKKVFNS